MRLVKLAFSAAALVLMVSVATEASAFSPPGKGGNAGSAMAQPTSNGAKLTGIERELPPDPPAQQAPTGGDRPSRTGGGGGASGPSYPQSVLTDPGLLNGAMTADQVVQAQCTMLAVTGNTAPMCQPAAQGPQRAPAAPPPPDPREVARRAVLQLEIPAPTTQIGPEPNVNEWKMAVVGYPLWLWTTGPDRIDRTVTEQGITLNLSARRVTTKFDLGDGTVKFCGVTTPYHQGVQPAAESPSCGHRYQKPSLPKGKYAVSASTRWEISWSALGQSGVLPFERQGPVTQLPVGELVSVRTGG